MTATTTRPETADTPDPEERSEERRRNLRLGIALVVFGAIAIGYAAYATFRPEISVARSQQRLAVEFASDPTTAATDTPPPATTVAVAVPEETDFDNTEDVPVLFGDGNGTTIGVGPQMEVPDGWVAEMPPATGEALGRIVIPEIGLDWMLVQGVGVPDLKMGPGHMPWTAMPGQMGNAVISGHRTTYGAPFNRIDELNPGDQFTVETRIGTHTYEVISTSIVSPRDMWVTTQWDGAWLTMTTCNPKGSSRERLIVFSHLVDGPNADVVAASTNVIYAPPTPPTA